MASLTGLCIYPFQRVRQLASDAVTQLDAEPSADAWLSAPITQSHAHWQELGVLRSTLYASVSRAQLTLSSLPNLALLGTVLGFFYAIGHAGALDLSSQDPPVVLTP